MSNAEKYNDICSLVGSGAYLVEDLKHCDDFENQRFYQTYFDLNGITKMFLVTNFFSIFNFSIRKYVDNIYIISKEFYSLLLEFNVFLEKIIPLAVVNNNKMEKKSDNYLLVEFKSENFCSVLNLELSIFSQEYPDTIDSIEVLHVSNMVKSDFILIDELRPQFKTPICSNEFRKRFEEMKLTGIKFFDIIHAPWLNEDVLEYYFKKELNETNEEVIEPV